MDSVIVCVHGRSEQWHLKDQILADFQGGILEGLGRLPAPVAIGRERILLAFYGDLFLPDAALAPASGGAAGQRLSTAVTWPGEISSYRGATAPSVQQATQLTAHTAADPLYQINVARAILREAHQRGLIESGSAEGEQAPAAFSPHTGGGLVWLHSLLVHILQGLEHILGAPRELLRLFVSDVDLYLHNAALRTQVMGRLLALLRQQAGRSIIVVAHSLGTVVAYDVLNTHREIPITAFITLGSPLGLSPFIYQELLPLVPPGQKHPFPANVATWQNFYDPNDIVALVPALAPLFPGPPGQAVICTPVQNNPADPHSLTGYLIQQAVAQAINNALLCKTPLPSKLK
ncbi:alpha/beta hydrolase family protein [Thermogemmatispora tikiterensis]|uniref:Uncharacterized protein n=1 Tax=Thermogemmatispora tikiterensis TaxID=1825093 RepID=A0A328VCR8_9CHLR|nr:hypothetical protein [Thermogemmatispora tikiterensis]RAQ94591.1 hypothetical protein A4R35_03530 [Thermogemmatispora tikiterensis]